MSIEAILPSLDPTLVFLIAAIFLVSGTVKGFLGIGLPAAGMGFLTLFIAPTEAISLLWLPILFSNFIQFTNAPNRRAIMREYAWLAIAIATSILITSMFITAYPTALLTVAIGFAMVVFSVNMLFGVRLPIGPGRGWQVGAGLMAGVLGGLSSIWSPPVAMYLMARNVPKDAFIGAAGFLFLTGSIPLGAGLVISGLITWSVIAKSLIGLVMAIVGFRIGEIIRHRANQETFRRIVLIAFLIMGARLVATGLL